MLGIYFIICWQIKVAATWCLDTPEKAERKNVYFMRHCLSCAFRFVYTQCAALTVKSITRGLLNYGILLQCYEKLRVWKTICCTFHIQWMIFRQMKRITLHVFKICCEREPHLLLWLNRACLASDCTNILKSIII